MAELKFDANTPYETACCLDVVGVKKAKLDFLSMFAAAILAGLYIGFGAIFCILVVHDSKLSFGLTKLLGGLVFCVGLILVVVAGAELFTGNNLMSISHLNRKITTAQLLRNWIVVYIGNFVGSYLLVILILYSGMWKNNSSLIGAKAVLIANTKVNLSFISAFALGILCNTLVCLAVWMCNAGRNVADKILAIIFPITAFVALGFEHSVANMFFIPFGILLKNDPSVLSAIQTTVTTTPINLDSLTWINFFFKNLLPVTLGNIVGGSILVGAFYWFIHHRKDLNTPKT